MKFQISSFAAILATVALFSSCSEGQYWDEPVNNAVYSFPKPAASLSIKAGEALDPYDVIITRSNADAEETVTLSSSFNDDEAFSAPSSVTFAAGQTSAVCTILINTDAMAVGVPYTAQIATPSFNTVNKADSLLIPGGRTNPIYPNGISPSQTNCKFTLTVRINYTWKSIGWVDYTDDYVSTFFSVPTMTYRVPIQAPVEEAGKGMYRLVNAYGQYYPFNEPGDWDSSVTSYIEINAQDPERVYIPTSEQATDWGYGNFICSSYAYYYLSQGYSAEAIAKAGLFGTLENGLITFPAETLLFGMADYNDGGLYDSNINGTFCVNLNTLSDQE